MDNEITKLWEDYEHGKRYQESVGLAKNLPLFVRFYEGKQWPAPTKNTKNLPRPVVNFIKMICRIKKSALLSTPYKLVYHAEDEAARVDKFNKFAEYMAKELGLDAIDKKKAHDLVIKGMSVVHFYWDAEARGKDGLVEGAFRCEVIDPLHVFFANPREVDEQKQKWILIVSREDVDGVRAKCDEGVDVDAIAPDEAQDDRYGLYEQEGGRLVTVLTRYFRRGGEVFCERATRSTVINKPFPIAPDIDKARRELGLRGDGEEDGVDAPNNAMTDDPASDAESLQPKRARASLYPIAVGNYEQRERSIYGLGEVEGLIPNQKAINFHLAMSLLNAQNCAWGKYVVLPTALNGQVITNEPGQTLIDHTGTGQGIKKMTEQSMQTVPLQIVDTLVSLTRVATGATEVMSGETLGAGMSGAAIAQLQAQARQPNEVLLDNFRIAKEKEGRVMAQFFKLYYTEKPFVYEDKVPVEMKAQGVMPMQEENQVFSDTFDSEPYRDMDFDVVAEAVSGTRTSVAGDITLLDTLYAKGAISLQTYIDAYPTDAVSNRSKILEGIERDAQSERQQLMQSVQTLEAQCRQYEAQMQQAAQLIEKQRAAVDKVTALIKENGELKGVIANLYHEAKTKVQAANQQIQLGNRKILETTADATEFASALAADRGMMPQQSVPITQMPPREGQA